MKLYFYPDACSRAPHIILRELGLSFTTVAVDMTTRKAADGRDFASVNPKGYVPALVLDDGEILTETVAILEYLADRRPGTVAPPHSSFLHYRLLEWLSFIGTELHKNFTPLFIAGTVEPAREAARKTLARRFDYLESVLRPSSFLVDPSFSTADAYLYVVAGWSGDAGVELARWPKIVAYRERIEQRPAVQATLAAERVG